MVMGTAGGDRCVADIAFVDGPGDGAGDDGSIIGAGDGDGDLLGRAVGGRIGDGVVDAIAGIEVLHRRLIEGVGPGAGGQYEAAVGVVTDGASHIGKAR